MSDERELFAMDRALDRALRDCDESMQERDALAAQVAVLREALGSVAKGADAVRDMSAAWDKTNNGHWLKERDLARIRLQSAVSASYAVLSDTAKAER